MLFVKEDTWITWSTSMKIKENHQLGKFLLTEVTHCNVLMKLVFGTFSKAESKCYGAYFTFGTQSFIC